MPSLCHHGMLFPLGPITLCLLRFLDQAAMPRLGCQQGLPVRPKGLGFSRFGKKRPQSRGEAKAMGSAAQPGALLSLLLHKLGVSVHSQRFLGSGRLQW